MKRIIAAVLAALALAAPAASQDRHEPAPTAQGGAAAVGDVTITNAWARAAAAPGGASAAYMTIETSGEGDRLLSVSTPVAARAEIHTHLLDEQGVARMRPVGVLEIEPGSPTVLEPGGLHVMLMGLVNPLIEDGVAPLTLVFEKAGETTVAAPVRPAGIGMGPGHTN